jgi:hypothetical protein
MVQAVAEPFTASLPVRWMAPVVRDFCQTSCGAPLAVVEDTIAKLTGYVDITLAEKVTGRGAFVVTEGAQPSESLIQIRGLVWGEPVGVDDTEEAGAFVERLRRGLLDALDARFGGAADVPAAPPVLLGSR